MDTKIEYNGHCALAMSLGKKESANGKYVLSKNGKTYSFLNPVAKLLFKLLPNRVAKADANWENM